MNSNYSQSVLILWGVVVALLSSTAAQAQIKLDYTTVEGAQRVSPASSKFDEKGATLVLRRKTAEIIPLDPTLALTTPGPAKDTPDGNGPGTAQRGECQRSAQNNSAQFDLKPLSTSVIQTESSPFPILWFDIKYPEPQSLTSILAEVSVEDAETSKRLLPKVERVMLPQQTGGFGIKLPHELQQGRQYRWYLYLACNITDAQSTDLQLEGEFHSPYKSVQ